jgi:photosystem II CP47 chlorophyll apoprotein
MFALPFLTRLGVTQSWVGWTISGKTADNPGIWTYEGVAAAHIVSSSLFLLASVWHWTCWDLILFRDPRTGKQRKTYQKSLVFTYSKWFIVFWFWCFPRSWCFVYGIWISGPYGLTGCWSSCRRVFDLDRLGMTRLDPFADLWGRTKTFAVQVLFFGF